MKKEENHFMKHVYLKTEMKPKPKKYHKQKKFFKTLHILDSLLIENLFLVTKQF